MYNILPYDREKAVAYAHCWAYGRNPKYYNYDQLGGDCTNFASQCLYVGTGVMNFTPTYGWYYRTANDKAPAWTGVPYFYNFMTRGEKSPGPFGVEVPINGVEPGDFAQFLYDGERYSHNPIIVSVGEPTDWETVLVAAHSDDADYRPLSSYFFQKVRFIHVLGAYSSD